MIIRHHYAISLERPGRGGGSGSAITRVKSSLDDFGPLGLLESEVVIAHLVVVVHVGGVASVLTKVRDWLVLMGSSVVRFADGHDHARLRIAVLDCH